MIKVTCPSANRNTHRYMYGLNKDMDLISLQIENGGVNLEVGLTVKEARDLAIDLLEWTSEITEETA